MSWLEKPRLERKICMIGPEEHKSATARAPPAVTVRRAFFLETVMGINSPSSLLLLIVRLPVLTGSQAGFLLEEPDETGDVTVSNFGNDILQGHVGLRK